MKLSLSCIIFLSYLFLLTPVFAGTQTLSTYYPAPQGNYLNMTVNKALTLSSGVGCSSPTSGGAVIIADNGGILQICDGSGSYGLSNNSLWQSGGGGGGSWIFPVNTAAGEGVSIGGSGATPGSNALLVTGTTNLAGALTVSSGLATFSNNALVTGTLTVNGGLASLNLGLVVTGGGATVTGGVTTLNNGVTVNGAVATINNGLTVSSSGTLTVQNGTQITLCTGGANCGILQVTPVTTGGTTSYYATYAP